MKRTLLMNLMARIVIGALMCIGLRFLESKFLLMGSSDGVSFGRPGVPVIVCCLGFLSLLYVVYLSSLSESILWFVCFGLAVPVCILLMGSFDGVSCGRPGVPVTFCCLGFLSLCMWFPLLSLKVLPLFSYSRTAAGPRQRRLVPSWPGSVSPSGLLSGDVV